MLDDYTEHIPHRSNTMNHPTALESIAFGITVSMVSIAILALAFYKYTGAI